MKTSDENQKQFIVMCKHIKEWRIQKQLSLEMLSKLGGIPQGVLENAEAFTLLKEFSTEHLFALCRIFGRKPHEFFE